MGEGSPADSGASNTEGELEAMAHRATLGSSVFNTGFSVELAACWPAPPLPCCGFGGFGLGLGFALGAAAALAL